MQSTQRSALIVAMSLALFACAPAADPVQSEEQAVESAPTAVVQEPTAILEDADQASEPMPDEPAVDFDPFEEGLSGGNTDEFPFPATDDAFDFENLLGLYSYMTYYDLDDLVMLYQAAMPMLGYDPNSDTVIPEMAILSYQGDGKALTVNVSTNADGTNKVSILVGTLQ